MGVKVLKNLNSMDSGTIIIRSHGVASDEISEAMHKKLEIVDAHARCQKGPRACQKPFGERYGVVVVGDADHPEVQGIVSYGGDNVLVVGSGDEVKNYQK